MFKARATCILGPETVGSNPIAIAISIFNSPLIHRLLFCNRFHHLLHILNGFRHTYTGRRLNRHLRLFVSLQGCSCNRMLADNSVHQARDIEATYESRNQKWLIWLLTLGIGSQVLNEVSEVWRCRGSKCTPLTQYLHLQCILKVQGRTLLAHLLRNMSLSK